jgi:CO/xanthine dehydrogenase Mo-binding subunit
MGEFGIGQPVRRFEDKRLLSGNGRFQNDNNLLGQTYAYVLRSPPMPGSARSTSRRRRPRPASC